MGSRASAKVIGLISIVAYVALCGLLILLH